MRLIDVREMCMVEFLGDNVPPYYILSHTWGEEEVSYQDFTQDQGRASRMRGYAKIRRICEVAQAGGIGYAWVDTCCIDKTSSAELTEAINSMYSWYENAECCYAFLEDFAPPADLVLPGPALPYLGRCRWFTRGWCLQELIAPANGVEFVDKNWRPVGTRHELADIIEGFSGVDAKVLTGETKLRELNVATKMAWAARRATTRPEDMAYCLLGLFGVNMPLLYGEGGERAFLRLQEEIVRTTEDGSIFAWISRDPRHQEIDVFNWHVPENWSGLLARSPTDFEGCPLAGYWPQQSRWFSEVSITSRGVKFTGTDLSRTDALQRNAVGDVLLLYACSNNFGIYVLEVRPQVFVRVFPRSLTARQMEDMVNWPFAPTSPAPSSGDSKFGLNDKADDMAAATRRRIHKDLTIYMPRFVDSYYIHNVGRYHANYLYIDNQIQANLTDVHPRRLWASTRSSFIIDSFPTSVFVTFRPPYSPTVSLTLFVSVRFQMCTFHVAFDDANLSWKKELVYDNFEAWRPWAPPVGPYAGQEDPAIFKYAALVIDQHSDDLDFAGRRIHTVRLRPSSGT